MTAVQTLYPVSEVAALLRCSRGHVYNLIAEGRIRTVSIGIGQSKTRIPESALITYLRGIGVATEPPAGPANPPNPTKPRAVRRMTEPTPQPTRPVGPSPEPNPKAA